jgi:hypothetical protein
MSLLKMTWLPASLAAVGLLALLSVPSDSASSLVGYGSYPELPFPQQALFPTVNIAPAKSWAEGEKPSAVSGFDVGAFA